jgi:hypothetical protein
MSGSGTKPPPSVEEFVAQLTTQMEKLVTAFAAIQTSHSTIQGNQTQLTVAINCLQSEQLTAAIGSNTELPPDKSNKVSTNDVILHAARHGHKLLFHAFDVSEDLLPWLNQCVQFFHIQKTPQANKVFLATFYMSSEASQWYTLLERNRGQPSWAEFVKLVNQRFSPPLQSNPLGELIQLRWDGLSEQVFVHTGGL